MKKFLKLNSENELSDYEFFSAEEVASYQAKKTQEDEDMIEERLLNTRDIVIIDECL